MSGAPTYWHSLIRNHRARFDVLDIHCNRLENINWHNDGVTATQHEAASIGTVGEQSSLKPAGLSATGYAWAERDD